jgi:hypothetical protein
LAKVEKEKLLGLLEKDPASGMLFFRRLAAAIGQRLVGTYNTIISGQAEERAPSYG